MLTLPLNADISVEDLVREFPAAVGFLRRRNIVCLQCGEPIWGTLGELIAGKGQDVAQVMADLNAELDTP